MKLATSRRPVSLLAAAVLTLAVCFCRPEHAAAQCACDVKRYVAPTGNDAANDCRVLAYPCATIQYAVNQASPGETVVVAAGLYAEPVSIAKPLVLAGAQAGVDPAGRTPGGPAESIVDAAGLQGGITITSGDVSINGMEIVGDTMTFYGIGLFGNIDLPNVTIRNNFVHGMKLANPFARFTDFAYGIFAVTGSAGARKQISGLVIGDNEIFDVGVAPTSAGAAIYLNNVVGGAVGAGATITGNELFNLATLGAHPNFGIGLVVDAAADNALGFPITAASGVLIAGNTYVNSDVGAAVFAGNTNIVENVGSFSGVTALIVNLARLSNVDRIALGKHAKSDGVLFVDADGYFATLQAAIDRSRPNAAVEATADTFDEPVVDAVGVRLRGAKAGQDARIRNTSSGETILPQGVRIRANAASVDGFTIAHPGGPAVHVDANDVVGVEVKNVFVNGGPTGFLLARALSASVSQNRVQNVTGAAIEVGSDAGSTNPSDDVQTIATIKNNEIEGSRFGITGFMTTSQIRSNEIRNYTGPSPGAGISGQLLDALVESNAVNGYTQTPAIEIAKDAERPTTTNTIFKCNTLSGNLFGVRVDPAVGQLDGVVLNSNNIAGNTVGLDNESSATLDAHFNWWGCPTGPDTSGCDLTIGPAGLIPFLDAPSACTGCSQDAQCDDGLFCNGPETCDLVNQLCQAGTPPVCDLGGGHPDCNVSSCGEGTGCIVDPVLNGSPCEDGVTCSVPDSCENGQCVEAGNGDVDADLVCGLDDNCPNVANADQADADADGVGDACDLSSDEMTLDKIGIRSGTGNARIAAKGTLIADAGQGDVLDVTGTITATVTDSAGFSYQASFPPGQCLEKKGKINCGDKSRKLKFTPHDSIPVPGGFKFKFQVKSLSFNRIFQGPVLLRIEHSSGLLRLAAATACTPSAPFIHCED